MAEKKPHPEPILAIRIKDEVPVYLPRDFLETCEEYRQVISVVVLKDANENVLAFQRGEAGSEERLHGLWSIGWGGHVEELDLVRTPAGEIDVAATAFDGARRELWEELAIVANKKALGKVRRVIRLNDSPVDRVHEGHVFYLTLERGPLTVEATAENAAWVTLEELLNLLGEGKLESWSAEIVKDLWRDSVLETSQQK